MQRVAVVGSGGAGKTTFARRLGAVTGLPVVHLDEHYWMPGWVEPERPDWAAAQRELVAAPRWILDGNYGGTAEIRLAAADTVVFLRPPRQVCTVRVVRRWATSRGAAVQAPGCPERIDLRFLRWVWRYPLDSGPRMERLVAEHASGAEVHDLRSSADVEALLVAAREQRGRGPQAGVVLSGSG